jgi:DNA-binding NarL/FixJ family response regulator
MPSRASISPQEMRTQPSGSHGTERGVILSSVLDTNITNAYPPCMETRAALRQRVRHERQLQTRLHLATTRLDEVARERLRAIMAAHRAGWAIRQIAAATGLSRSRIH